MIRARELSVFFGRTVALDSLTLELSPGIVGLFGPNGSGKSTLLRVAAGLLRPSRGLVTWDDVAISASSEAFRRSVGYLGHQSGLYGRLTVAENLGLAARLYGMGAARVGEILEATGMSPLASRPAGALSAGLKRRAALARALLHEPRLLLLDEPYANLDDAASEIVSAAIRTWWAAGRTAIIATHGAKKLKGWVDAGVVLQRGRVITAGEYHSRGRFTRETPGPA